MPELTISHKQALGDLLLELDEGILEGQIAPEADSPHVQALLVGRVINFDRLRGYPFGWVGNAPSRLCPVILDDSRH